MEENGLDKLRTIVSEVSYFVGNPVPERKICSFERLNY